MITFVRCDCNNEDFVLLTKRLDADLNSRYGELQNSYNQFNRIHNIYTAMVVLEDKTPVGCGCFKHYDDHTVEMKRIYVHPDCRGKGIGKKMMGLLENWAAELGSTRAILETGKNQPEAVHVYEKIGYTKTENYGPYAGNDNSVCFSKELK